MDLQEQRQQIIASVFSRRNDEGYVSHLRIWEDAGADGGGRKPRYILLSQSSTGTGYMHKSKRNTNGTFSVGKTWRVAELRGLQVINPQSFNITLTRTYRWDTETRDEQAQFLQALVRVFRTETRGAAPLHLEGVPEPADQSGPPAATPSNYTTLHDEPRRIPSPAPSSSYRNGAPTVAPPGERERTSSTRSRDAALRNRPPSIQVPSPAGVVPSPRQNRRPSNAASTISQVPSISSLATQSRPGPVANSVSRDSQQSRDFRQAPDHPAKSRNASPAPSARSARSRPPPTRTDTIQPQENGIPHRRDQNVRISYFDPSNQASLDRLLTNNADSRIDIDGEEESARATLTNVEEMIEGYEWASDDVIGRKSTRGAIDLIEARLLDELTALEKANVHSFLESDDRIGIVMKYLDEAITELDSMDGLISSYKIHLNASTASSFIRILSNCCTQAVSDDILFIQSQNRGLQVQTQNQRALLGEIQNLLRTVHVDQDALITLTQGSLEKTQSIQQLEEAAAELYKALQAGRDTDMAATMERLQEYRTHNSQFCKRMFDFLSIMFTAQSSLLVGNSSGLVKAPQALPVIALHQDIEAYLGRYAGLMLYLKEMDETIYAKLCAAYFSSMSELHQTQITSLLAAYLDLVKADEEDQDSGFGGGTAPGSKGGAGMRRAGTLIRSPLDGRGNRDKDKTVSGDQRASEVFDRVLDQIQTSIYREGEFIVDFLQINDAGLTFADYMGLDNYFRRQATRSAGLSQTTMKLIRGAMDLIFGFLPAEIKVWLDNAIEKDKLEVIGMLGTVERAIENAEQRNNPFFLNLLDKQHTRLKAMFDRYIAEQLKVIEQTKLTSKKRRGVAHFIKYFPSYVIRVENQLAGAEGREVRSLVDAAYEKIVKGMFEALRQMAKLEGEGEDKGQLNYHVILLENMYYFLAEMSKMEMGSTNVFCQSAQVIFDENLSAYIRIVFRRPFAKLTDFFDAVERLGPDSTNLSSTSTYNKSALRKVLKEYNAKDVRKNIEGLYKRVEKHFADSADGNDAVFSHVWQACEDELLSLTDKIIRLISQYYGDSGVALEFSKSDIESAFKKTRSGS